MGRRITRFIVIKPRSLSRMKVTLLLLFAVLASSQGQLCVTPEEWEAEIFTIYFQGTGSEEPSAIRRGKESYDAVNERRRFIEEFDTSATDRYFYDELYLHKEQIGYKLNLRTRVCEKFVLSEPWVPYEVPANTTLDYTYYLGSAGVAGNSVEMNFFSGDTERGYYRGVWTTNGCIPYVHSYLSTYPTSSYHRTTFYDVTAGISDPNVFIPPSECQ